MNAKISILTILAGFSLVFAGCSKNDDFFPDDVQVPQTVTDAFNSIYPKAKDTKWTVKNDYYVATFENNTLDNTAWFDHEATWAMIKTEIPSGLLPQAVRSAVKQSYSDWVIQDADTIGRANMGTVYKVEIEKNNEETDVYYSVYGDLIKAVDNQNDTDTPIVVPKEVISLINITFSGAELLDMEAGEQGYTLYMLDKTVFKIAQLNKDYRWQSTTWKLSLQEVPEIVTQAFENSVYSNDPVSSIYTLLNANGTFFLFNLIHNGVFTTVKFDAIGNIVE